MKTFRRLVAAAAVALAVPAAPAAAAPVLEELAPCYVSAGAEENRREAVAVRGHGFTPGVPVDVLVDGAPVLSGIADPIGDVEATVVAPFQRRGERAFGVAVVERNNPASAATAESRVTALRVSLRPKRARPSRRVRYRGRGFTGEGAVYAHYLFGGEERKRVRLVRRTRGDCGRFGVRSRQIPLRRPRTGDWTVQVDQQREFSTDPATNWVQLLIRVRRVFQDP